MVNTIWRCKCGNVAYGKFPPEECPKCWKIDSFKVSDNADAEIEEDLLDDIRPEEWGEDETYGGNEEW